MAMVTGNEVKFVRCNTQAQYNDITPKVGSTLYWVVETKKIILDGTEYGFNPSDIDATLLTTLMEVQDTNSIDFTISVVSGKVRITGEVRRVALDNMITDGAGGLQVSATAVDLRALDVVQTEVLSKKGTANGFASLDGGGKVPSSQLPSYVDDVREYANVAAFPATGESGVIYVATDTNKTYRWSGTAYVEISASLALGETSSTAYRGDRGKQAYDHSLLTSGNPHNVNKADVGLDKVGNYSVATKVVAESGVSNDNYMTPLRTKEAIDALAPKQTWTVIS